MPSHRRCQLIARDNGAGLSRDLQCLAEALREAGHVIEMLGLPHRGRTDTSKKSVVLES